MEELKGLLFDIQSFSVHDGPGCRTVIFLKGCNLRCPWCSNPEGINPFPEIMYYEEKCRKDYSCINACPTAISFNQPGDLININRKQCLNCSEYKCVQSCLYDALKKVGYYITVSELIKRIQRDRNYWGSAGGITLSGGEPLLQHSFVRELLKICHDSYIHTAIETCGNVPWEYFKEILNYVDWIFYDIKHMDSEIHKKAIGMSNELILKNAHKIALLKNHRIIFRMTIVPGYNDTFENITATANFIKEIGKDEVNILSFHQLGSSKYRFLGRRYECIHLKPCNKEKLMELKEIFAAHNIKCYVGNHTPF